MIRKWFARWVARRAFNALIMWWDSAEVYNDLERYPKVVAVLDMLRKDME